MDAEILFFMTSKDQSNFLEIVSIHCDSMVQKADSTALKLYVGSCYLLFTPSILEGNTLFSGKLEIRMSDYSDEVNLKDQERTKSVFRKLRNWLKKQYWSRLAYLNQNKKGKLTPSRNHWLGQDAKLWKERDEKIRLLRLSPTSWMVFELGY